VADLKFDKVTVGTSFRNRFIHTLTAESARDILSMIIPLGHLVDYVLAPLSLSLVPKDLILTGTISDFTRRCLELAGRKRCPEPPLASEGSQRNYVGSD
jgi:hypothetical protein